VQLAHPLVFLKGYLRNPRSVGSIAPSSKALAMAVCEPLRRYGRRAAILEVGAGTGPITRYIGQLLGPGDEFDICEVDDNFADVLERDVLTHADFAPGVADGRVRLLRKPVQELNFENRYDFVICGLPFTSFGIRDVRDILQIIRQCLRPSGIMSYYEYVGFRRVSRTFALGKSRKRFRRVSAYLSRSIARHQFREQTVFLNFPPAHARHLRFDEVRNSA